MIMDRRHDPPAATAAHHSSLPRLHHPPLHPSSASRYPPFYSSPSHPAPTYAGPAPPPPGPPPPSHGPGPALPPLQHTAYSPSSAPPPEQQSLPPIHDPSAPPPSSHDPRDGAEHSSYNQQQSRSGHATPAHVSRPYSHDSAHQRTPGTPVGPTQQFPPPQQDGAPPSHRPPSSMDHGGHPNYPPSGAMPHGMPPPQQHHDHHPQYMPPMMDAHHPYGGHAPPMYSTPTYGPAAGLPFNGPRRGKTVRATQACEQCRSRKQKCDEGNPCAFCKENSLPCQYRDTPPAKTDKNMEKVFSLLEAQNRNIAGVNDQLNAMREEMRGISKRQRDVEQRLDFDDQPGHSIAGADPHEFGDVHDELHPPKRDTDHRVAPHKLLLLWPSIRPLLKKTGVKQIDSYVVQAEDRGIIRLWTRGEGNDDPDWAHSSGPASPAQSDGSGDAGTVPTPLTEGLWGSGFPMTPSSDLRRGESSVRRSDMSGAGGLKPNGELDLEPTTVKLLFDSYMRYMHVMHPFLDKRRVWASINAFLERYSPDRHGPARPGFVDSDHRPLKRQRSNGSSNNVGPSFDGEVRREVRAERSPTNAIIYLVLALGKICLHKDPLPALLPENRLQNNTTVPQSMMSNRGFIVNSPITKPSPASPRATPTTQPTPPSETGRRDSRSRRSSIDGLMSSGLRNIDVIPGLAYYAKAAEILGDQGDGNDLIHAQMFLLAGLYKGQLARVRESMSWITMAGRAILYLCDRYKLYNTEYWKEYDILKQHKSGQELTKDARRNQVVLAAWTALQLESDILSEMPFPASGLILKEDWLIMPNRISEDEDYSGLEPEGRQQDENQFILMAYSAQLYLRKRHNQVHRQLYGSESLHSPLSEVQALLRGHEETLAEWRNNLPPQLRWDDDDPPSSNILLARLQGKYWGGKYIINRPFLDYALHYMHLVKNGKEIRDIATDADGNWRHHADIHLFEAIARFDDRYIGEATSRCIQAAMKSTVAFDGVMGPHFNRLPVTNIHGTAHAQFGNMLVLSAAYECTYLRHNIDSAQFKSLMERTIKFLSRLAPISPTSANDVEILEKFYHYLFEGGLAASEPNDVYRNEGVEAEATSTTTSFSGPGS